MNYIFDTSVIIDALRQNKSAEVVFSKFEDTDHHLFISSITILELFSGKSSKDKKQVKTISDFLEYFTEIDVNSKIAKVAGEIYRDITKDLGVPDYIIAATAIEIGAQVVTLNKKHFSQIPQVVVYEE